MQLCHSQSCHEMKIPKRDPSSSQTIFSIGVLVTFFSKIGFLGFLKSHMRRKPFEVPSKVCQFAISTSQSPTRMYNWWGLNRMQVELLPSGKLIISIFRTGSWSCIDPRGYLLSRPEGRLELGPLVVVVVFAFFFLCSWSFSAWMRFWPEKQTQ